MDTGNSSTDNHANHTIMKHWQQYNPKERLQLLDIASAEKALPRQAIEKDWWVTMVLEALSQTRYSHLLSFKGGTSLSKGWRLIERFSEDIDIALKREERFAITDTTNNQLAKVRRKARHYIVRELPDELTDILGRMGIVDFTVEPELTRKKNETVIDLRADTDPSVIYVNYRTVLPDISEYMPPRVKIEISCRSMNEPVENKSIRSFISEVRPKAEDVVVQFNTVVPTRTFLEKMFLLHEEFQKEKPRSKRMSRHLYDLEKIMDTPFGETALKDKELYEEIVRHRSVFTPIDGVDYTTHAPQTINFIPPQQFMDKWNEDYAMLTNEFLYYNGERLSFEHLMNRIRELLERVRKM